MLVKIIKLWSFLEKCADNDQMLIFQNNYSQVRSSTLLRKPTQKKRKNAGVCTQIYQEFKDQNLYHAFFRTVSFLL